MYIVMQIMQEIYITDTLSHQYLAYSMVLSLADVPGKNLRFIEAVPIQKQEQCT